MHNQVFLIGRITGEPVRKELEDGKRVVELTIASQRTYKNEEGIYETDFVPVILWNAIADNVLEYCRKGDLVGVKGRIETNMDNDGTYKMNVVADKVTFLASKRGDE